MNTQRPIYISFYTAGTLYEPLAKKLEASLTKHGVINFIRPLKNTGSWSRNAHKKAKFILETMDSTSNSYCEFPAYIWIDADAIVHKPPDLFRQLIDDGYDFAAHFRTWRHAKNELLSGTLFFANNAKARGLIRLWIKYNKLFPGVWEQVNLARALAKTKNVKVFKLPIEYCCIFDDERRKKIDPAIEHFQASRKARIIIGR